MSVEVLITKIRQDLHELPLDDLSQDSVFKELDGWNSLHGLILMAMVSTEYGVDLTGEQIHSSKTVQDLYDIIHNKN